MIEVTVQPLAAQVKGGIQRGFLMYFAWLALMMIVGYVAGSVNFAILLTRARTGQDIRALGNRNPGTANVGRNLGRGWGALVLLLDALKGLAPMLAARFLFFPGAGPENILAVYGVGFAAIVGHCRPLFHGFKGGGGIATSMPVFFFFIPIEFFASILLGSLGVVLFIPKVQFRVGRWIPILFVTITPFLTLAVNLLVSVPIVDRLSLGAHPWSVLVGVFATAFLILGFNVPLLRTSLPQLGASEREKQARPGG
jgi:glycerol-3-phosphate acyltransferase PlsY